MFKLAVFLVLQIVLPQHNVASKNVVSSDQIVSTGLLFVQNYKQAHRLNEPITINAQYDFQSWISSVKSKAEKLINNLKERLSDIRKKGKAVVEEIFSKDGRVPQCLKKDSGFIEKIIKNIVASVSKCMSDNMAVLSKFEEINPNLEHNLNEQLYQCTNKETFYECNDLVNEIKKNALLMENKLQVAQSEARSVIDELFDKMMSCTIESLVDTSSSITFESIRIMKCVIIGDK